MKKSKFSETQIIKILKQQESGESVTDICREHGISQGTFYGWKVSARRTTRLNSESIFYNSAGIGL